MPRKNKKSNWLKKHKMQTAIISLFVLIAVPITAYLLIHDSKPNMAVNSPNDSSSDIAIDSSSPNGGISLAPQDTLSQWKSDPNYQNPLTGISYSELFHNSDRYEGKFIHYKGEVIQVLGDSGNWNLRVNITQKGNQSYSYWDDTALIYSYSPDRVIEKDIIEFTAQANGLVTYKSVLGADITIPALTIYEQQVVGRQE